MIMKYIYKSGETVKELRSYPNKDEGSKILGFDYENDSIYVIVAADKPDYDSNTHYLQFQEEYTEELYEGFHNVKICNHTWSAVQLSDEQIIENLTNHMGNYLDAEYPMHKREKHSAEGCYYLLAKIEGNITQEQEDRRTYIDSMYDWITSVRADRDTKEEELITNNTLPSFEWEAKPE